MASFGGALTGGVLLKEDSRAAMTAPEYKNGLWPAEGADSLSYGLGWDAVEAPALMTYEGVTMALAKGGDTQLYHASLVVLPEQKLSCAVVSSGGSSIYNQSAAETILAAVLEERGYTPIMLEGTAAAPERAALTAAQVEAWAGHYGSSSMDAAVSLTADGTLTLTYHPLYGLPEQTFIYHSDGAFYDAGGTVSLRFVQEGEQIYLWQQGVTELPGLGNLYTSSYFLQKLPDNPIDENVASAWRPGPESCTCCLTSGIPLRSTLSQFPEPASLLQRMVISFRCGWPARTSWSRRYRSLVLPGGTVPI